MPDRMKSMRCFPRETPRNSGIIRHAGPVDVSDAALPSGAIASRGKSRATAVAFAIAVAVAVTVAVAVAIAFAVTFAFAFAVAVVVALVTSLATATAAFLASRGGWRGRRST